MPLTPRALPIQTRRDPREGDIAIDNSELENRFTYHKPTGNQVDRYHELRDEAKCFAEVVLANTPESREQSLALTKIEEATMWANAAIARREPSVEPTS